MLLCCYFAPPAHAIGSFQTNGALTEVPDKSPVGRTNCHRFRICNMNSLAVGALDPRMLRDLYAKVRHLTDDGRPSDKTIVNGDSSIPPTDTAQCTQIVDMINAGRSWFTIQCVLRLPSEKSVVDSLCDALWNSVSTNLIGSHFLLQASSRSTHYRSSN